MRVCVLKQAAKPNPSRLVMIADNTGQSRGLNTQCYEQTIGIARRAFASGLTTSVLFRRAQLKCLYKLLNENEDKFCEALQTDLGKPRFESVMTEVDFVLNDIRSALNNLENWTQPKKVSRCFVTLFDDNYTYYEPYGVAVVIGAWNYPIQLAFSPLVGAIAAGNACIVKPSEIAPATAALIHKLMPVYLHKDAYHCVLGDGLCAQALVGSPNIDYVFYTGSSQIGKLIYQAAAPNLTPCTLEMGGKSPVYIDQLTYTRNGSAASFDDALFETTVRRILWGKFLNTGQTCVAPDYVMCTRLVASKLMSLAPKIIEQFYKNSDPIDCQDYGRIVSERHYNRLVSVLRAQLSVSQSTRVVAGDKGDEKVPSVIGGQFRQDARNKYYIAPTLLLCSSFDEPIMQSEIFGPIMPVVVVADEQSAIELINSRDKPLSLYLFSKRDELVRRFRQETSSGSICVNDTVIHLIAEALPFGGVGKSGIGAYHGKHSFETFSHEKSVLVRGFNPIIEWVAKKRYPPYSENHLRRMLRLLKRRSNPISAITNEFKSLICFLLGLLVCSLYLQVPIKHITL